MANEQALDLNGADAMIQEKRGVVGGVLVQSVCTRWALYKIDVAFPIIINAFALDSQINVLALHVDPRRSV